MFGIVSSGPSSIAIDMTYDKKRLDEAIKKIAGDGLKPSEIIQSARADSEGPTELRHRAHVAFSTMYEALQNLENVHNRRKALVWVSEGYDFNPFQESRLVCATRLAVHCRTSRTSCRTIRDGDETTGAQSSTRRHAAEAERDVQRRGPVAASSARSRGRRTAPTRRSTRSTRAGWWPGRTSTSRSTRSEWTTFVRKSQDSLRVLAEETGRHRRRQPERLRQGPEADRCGDERLLRARVLLEQPRPARSAAGRSR